MLAAVVREAASRWGDASYAIAPGGWTLSYTQLDRISDEVAATLSADGIGVGDVVVLRLPTSPDHVIAYVACAKVGATTAAINQRLTPSEQDALVELARPSLVIDDSMLGDSPDSVLWPLRRGPATVAPLPEDPDRPVAVVFTSGTTGLPKAATFGARQLRFITQVDTRGRWGGGGASLGATSLAHLGPTTKLTGSLMRGGTTVLVDRWHADAALELTERHAMSTVAGIPTQIAMMLRDPAFAGRDLSAVRAVIMGGAPATAALVAEAAERLGAAVAVRYSCTEAGIGTGTSFTDPISDAAESVGRPHDGVTLSIRDPESGEAVAPGEIGEVCFASPAVMSGYWRDHDATAAVLYPDGALRTGDLGRVDHRGRLVLAGRSREMYVRGGYNVFPIEVEGVLATIAGVAEVAVVARPDDVMGEVGVAFVVAEPGATVRPDDVRRAASDRLAHHKLPHDVIVVDALPLTPMDKVDKRALTIRAVRAALAERVSPRGHPGRAAPGRSCRR